MITNKDLLKDISDRELTQLSDINGKGEINQEVIDDAMNDAISFIESFIVLPSTPTSLLKKILVQETIYELRVKNKLLSDDDKENRKTNEGYLIKMSTGRLITEKREDSTASVPKENKSFAFRHRKNRRVNTKGFR